MHCYETKIINRSGDVSLQAATDYLNDFAAICAARKLCGEGEVIEVWRDELCVYSERPQRSIALIWPVIAGKAAGQGQRS